MSRVSPEQHSSIPLVQSNDTPVQSNIQRYPSPEQHSTIPLDMFCFPFHHFFQDSWRRKIHELFGVYMYRHTDEERHGGGGRTDIPDDSGNAARPQLKHSLQKKTKLHWHIIAGMRWRKALTRRRRVPGSSASQDVCSCWKGSEFCLTASSLCFGTQFLICTKLKLQAECMPLREKRHTTPKYCIFGLIQCIN